MDVLPVVEIHYLNIQTELPSSEAEIPRQSHVEAVIGWVTLSVGRAVTFLPRVGRFVRGGNFFVPGFCIWIASMIAPNNIEPSVVPYRVIGIQTQ